MANILLVEDDVSLAEMTSGFLRSQGHDVTVNHGEGVVDQVLATQPDLVILDVELPNETGLSICRRVRDGYRGPILMLTARSTDIDEVIGLEMGADDYVRKPVDPRVLALRVTAMLRRFAGSGGGPERGQGGFSDAHLAVDAQKREVRVMGELVEVTTAELELVLFLVERVGTPASREDYFREVRGISYDGLDRTYDNRVSKLRKKLEAAGLPSSRIATVRGVGYQLNRA